MAEIKEQKPQGMMSKQEESEDTGFIARMIPDKNERRATGRLIGDALTSLSTMFGSTATQLGAMREEEEISDERQALAVQAAENRIAVVGAENKKRAKGLEKILDRRRVAQNNAQIFFGNPMYKKAKNKIIASGKITLEEFNALEKDPDIQASLGKTFGILSNTENPQTAAASLVQRMYEEKEDPKVMLFSRFKVPFYKQVKTTLDQQTEQALGGKPNSIAENIDARRPEKIPGQIASKVKLNPDYKEKEMTGAGKIFPVLDGSGALRLERAVQGLIASNRGLKLVYPEGDFSTTAKISSEGTTGSKNDISFGTKAMELARSMINSGYSETDADILYRDVTLILQNAAPRNEESDTEQKDFEKRVDQIKLELSKIDNRFERKEKIEQLKKGEGLPKKTDPVVTTETLALSLLGLSSDTEAPEYLINTYNSDPNIERVEDNIYNVTVKKGTDKYPAGTVVSIKVESGKVISITDTKQKADVVPSTYEEWKALPEETIEQQKAKRRFINIEVVRKGIQEENRKKKDQQ
jgi:hypothetical protein